MLSLKDIGNLTEKDIMVREINMGDSYDEEGIIFMNIEVVGSDGENNYVMIINDFIQYDTKEYYLTKPLAIEVKNPE